MAGEMIKDTTLNRGQIAAHGVTTCRVHVYEAHVVSDVAGAGTDNLRI